MKVSGVEKKETNKVLVTVEFESHEFEDALNKAYRKNRNSIMIPGFRKGKAPRKIVEKMYGADIFNEDALEIICPDAFEKAIEEEKIEAVGKPRVEDFTVSDDRALTVVFHTAVYPEVTLGEYKGLGAVKNFAQVTEEEVVKELEELRKRNARIVSVEREAQDGDTVVIDFKGFVDDEAFEGGEAEMHSLTLGSGSFIPGFEEQLVGVKADDELDVNVKFPEEYTDDLKGKDAVFEVKVHEVKENILPELDDEFARDVSEFDTIEEYKKSIEDKINKEREETAVKNFKAELLENAVKNMQVEVPEEMVEEQADKMAHDFYYNLSSQGVDPDEYLKMMGMDLGTFRSMNRRSAESTVKRQLLLRAVYEAEDIQVTDEDREEQYKKLAENYKMDEEKVRTLVQVEDLDKDIKLEKASELIYSTGIEKEPEAEAEAEVETETEAEAEEKPVEKAPKKTRKSKKSESEAEVNEE